MRKLNSMNIILSLDKAIDILNILTKEKEWLSIDEIVKMSHYSKPTVYRSLYTMEQRGLVRYDSLKSKYNLGYKLIEYGDSLLASQNILQESEYLLNDLYNKVKQTVLLAIAEGDSLIYIYKRSRNIDGLVYSSSVGQKRDLTYGALGRVLMAYLPESRIDQILEKPLPSWTSHSIRDKEIMRKELQKITKDRICIEVNEAAVGVTGVASPIFGLHGRLIAVLGVLGPTVQLTDQDTLIEVKDLVYEASIEISQIMGHSNQ